MGLVRHDDKTLYIRDMFDNGFNQGDKSQIHKDVFVLRMVYNVGNLLGEQAGIYGVANGAHSGNPVINFHVTVSVPGEGGDTITLFDVQLGECLRQLARANGAILLSIPMNRPFNGSRNNFLIAMIQGCKFN